MPLTRTKEQFIEKACKVHGEKYDYSKTNYLGTSEKIIIICPKHGEFIQTPNHHINSKSGCQECSGCKKVTTEDLIRRGNIIHNNKYDYSKVICNGNKRYVIIICSQHGEFQQSPNAHLRGQGCSYCAGNALYTQERFIREAIKKHNNLYDYSKSQYIAHSEKLIIICKKHGEFLQTPNSHLRGAGCPVCGGTKKLTQDEFIKRAIEVHGNKYDYSKVKYISIGDKIIIICKTHGKFKQRPNDHIKGQGCIRCANKKQLTTTEFIKNARKVHGSKYDYSKSKYTTCMNKLIITCPKHGDFEQAPNSHISAGNGCTYCYGSKSKAETLWLNSLNIPQERRNKTIIINGRRFKPDATVGNTIYEFYGDFWHGNPKVFNSKDINISTGKKFGELYAKTMEREQILKEAGYEVVSIWENDFDYFKALNQYGFKEKPPKAARKKMSKARRGKTPQVNISG